MKKIALLAMLFSFVSGMAQEEMVSDTLDYPLDEKTKRFSLGLKVGIPNIISLSSEIVTPWLENRIAPYADISAFGLKDNETDIDLNNTEFGVNFYLGNRGKGFYMAVGRANLSANVTYFDTLENGIPAEGKSNIKIQTTNLKLGVKTGERIYFRFEFGYGLTADIPETIEVLVKSEEGNQTQSNTYAFPTIPGVGTQGVLIGNFGFGIAF